MSTILTNIVQTEPFTIRDAASAVRFDYFSLHEFTCPIILFDHVQMWAAGFPPHPHAGLAVFSYLLENSAGALRDRDSLNDEVLVEPGDLLWFQMASGMIHEENPAQDGAAVNQLQVWINLSPESQKLPPATMLLKSADIPIIHSGSTTVRVVLGDFLNEHSPLIPTEPFNFLDIQLHGAANIHVAQGWTGMVYAIAGTVGVSVAADNESATLGPGQVIGIRSGADVTLTGDSAQALYFSRPILDNPPVVQGMYAMASQEAIDAAKRKFHAGHFGDVAPYFKITHPGQPYLPAGQDPDLDVNPVVMHQATVRHYDEGWWSLHFQYCRYEYTDYETAYGYRFIWTDPDGKEKPYRTGGYIPYMDYITTLLESARQEGWADLPYRDSF
ncbi:MAG: pirin family protein [Planctomycetes bacterium]|nr:pirin family protein [Planctomycetota bacterium]